MFLIFFYGIFVGCLFGFIVVFEWIGCLYWLLCIMMLGVVMSDVFFVLNLVVEMLVFVIVNGDVLIESIVIFGYIGV